MEKLTPKKLCNWVRRRLHVTYSVGSIKRILRTTGFSLKTSTTRLADAADAKAVRRWQRAAKDTIALAKRRGFRITVQDESIFVSTGRDGKKFVQLQVLFILTVKHFWAASYDQMPLRTWLNIRHL